MMGSHSEHGVNDAWERQKRYGIATAIICTFIIVGALAVTWAAQARAVREGISENREGVLCMLEQLSEHRLNNHALREQLADALGEEFETPAGPPLDPDPGLILGACTNFYTDLPLDVGTLDRSFSRR